MSERKSQVELIIDNFAGGGGASTGIEMATGRSVDIAINHDPDAIAMHRANHPHTRPLLRGRLAGRPVGSLRRKSGRAGVVLPGLHAFQQSKGREAVDKNIRGLAWVTIRWALKVRPRVIMLENVPEIRTWGPLGLITSP